jgi:NAD(P)H dehydrogenase (quinone)
MSRVLVLFAHPCEESFAAATHKVVVDTLTAKGWDVDDCDLNAEGFNPVLTADERRGYHDVVTNTAPVQSYVDRLARADALVLVFPVWNYGFPAILKGYFDRVFLPGVSFKLVDGLVKPNLTNIRKIAAVTSYGGTRLKTFLAGDPPRRVVSRSIRYVCQAQKLRYLALHDMNRVTAGQRAAHLARVQTEMEAF